MALQGRNPGKLDKRILLRYPVRAADAAGTMVEGFADFGSRWAEWLPLTGREFRESEAKQDEIAGTFRVRWLEGVRADWRIIWRGIAYGLIADPIDEGRESYLSLMVKKLADQGDSEVLTSAQAFIIDLDEGDESKTFDYPAEMLAAPAGVKVQLIIPVDGYNFVTDVQAGYTATTMTVILGAAVPGVGYQLSVSLVL